MRGEGGRGRWKVGERLGEKGGREEKREILTLCGVKCIMSNQWHCTLEDNKIKVNVTMKVREGRKRGR